MDTEYIKEPEDGLVQYGSEVLEYIRKEHNIDKKENREKAISIIGEWIREQDHFVKKDYCKGYIERSIITSNGSLERAKQQIDKMCTMRTLMPKYFQITNLRDSEIMMLMEKAYFAILPKLTKEHFRVVIVKLKPNQVVKSAYEFTLLFKLIALVAEYLKSNDCCRGYIIIDDFYDSNVSDILSKINIIEVQQFLPILTQGYGCKIKSLLLVTDSKFIEGFIKLIKPLFSEKVGNRIHAVTSRKLLHDLVHVDILPEDYGGLEKSMKCLHEDLIRSLSAASVQALFEDMHKAVTDESKRQIDQFNEQYMGMPGTFRTLSLD